MQSESQKRSEYLGSSDIAAILGMSKWMTPLQVWERKVHPMETDEAPTKAMLRGKRLERYILDMFEEELVIKVVRRGERYSHPEYPWMRAEVDGETNGDWNIEAKSVHPNAAKEWGEDGSGADGVPMYYLAQVHFALMVTGRPGCFVVALIGDDLRVYEVLRNDEWYKAVLIPKCLEFWRLVQSAEAPPPMSAEDCLSLWPQDDGEAVQADAKALEAVNTLRQAKEAIKAAEKQAEEAELVIKMAMADKTTLTFDGAPLATWKEQKSKRIDTKALPPSVAAQYTKESSTRVLRLK